jgi:type II secretory pathway component PulK
MRGGRRDGVVLLVVLFFALLLTSTVATFLSRSTVDAMIARNRENAAQADALASGGVRVAEAFLIEDRLLEQQGAAPPIDTQLDVWARLRDMEVPNEAGQLRITVEDTGARLNLNALFETDETGGFVARDESLEFLVTALEKIVDELPIPPGERALYDPRELSQNLIDWVDFDEERQVGGPEDDYYQRQDPPYRARNQPFLSVDELRLVEGFDGPLVDAMARYFSVYPFAPGGCGQATKGCGVNLNTAPPHVLALLYYDDGVDRRLSDEDLVRAVLKLRQEDGIWCPEGQSDPACTPISQLVTNANTIFPPPTASSEIFVVTAEARVGDVTRQVEAVVDRSDPAQLRLLSWRAR